MATQINDVEKIIISDIRSDEQLKDIPDQELLQLHHRLHQLYGAARERGEATEYPFVNVHLWTVEEMARRGMQHNMNDDLDKETERLMKAAVPEWVRQKLHEAREAVLVPAYVSLVGSATKSDEPRDVDVLVREDEDNMTKGWRESVMLLVRRLLDPLKERGLKLHMLGNPQGPHLPPGQGYIPLYDLVLRPRREAELVTKAAPAMPDWERWLEQAPDGRRFDLGPGEEGPPEGFEPLGRPYDLNETWPLEANSVAVLRANHVFEHLQEPSHAMTEAWRVLQPGGLLIVTVPEATSPGAVAHPEHHSLWNADSFKFWTNSDLLQTIEDRVPQAFELLHLDVREENGRRYVDAVLRKPDNGLQKRALVPIATFTPPKPAQKGRAHTDAFSPDEIWPWVEKHLQGGVIAEPKYNGFRAILQHQHPRLSIRFEDSQQERAERLLAADERLRTLHELPSCILDCDVGVVEDDGRWPRPRLMTLTADRPELPESAHIAITAFDVLYWDGESVNEKPFRERRALLEKIAPTLRKHGIEIPPEMPIRTKEDLVKAWRSSEFGLADRSEGLVLKALDWVYQPGPATDGMCLPPGTPIFVNGRVVPIEQVIPGMSLGERSVVAIAQRHAEELVCIEPALLPPIYATPEHRFEVIKDFAKKRRRKMYRDAYYRTAQPKSSRKRTPRVHHLPDFTPGFVPASEIRAGDALVLRKPQVVASLPEGPQFHDPDFYELLGWYVAEGSASGQPNIRLGRGAGETIDRLAEIARRYYLNVRVRHRSSDHYLGWGNGQNGGIRAWFIEQFGGNAFSKHIPDWIWAAPDECVLRFLQGYWAGDGSIQYEPRSLVQAATVSWELAWQLWFLLLRFGVVAGIRKYHGRSNAAPQWHIWAQRLPWMEKPDGAPRTAWLDCGDFFALPIKHVARDPYNGPVYHLQTTDERFLCPVSSHNSKIKHALEIKAIVLEVRRTKNGGYNFRGGVLPGAMGDELENFVEFRGRQYVDLGFSFNAMFAAQPGDIITAEVEEIAWDMADRRLNWLGAKPLDVDRERSEPYAAAQVIDMARRARVLQEVPVTKAAAESPGEGGETRGEAALRNWEQHWHEAMPTSGKALPFILHAHWRGLTEDEARLDMAGLLQTNNSLHFDLRLGTDRFNGWWGISLFAGPTAENRDELRIFRMMQDPDERLEGAPKQFGARAWLKVGLDKPLIVGPGGVGSTSKAFSKFFAIDHGTWRLGMARQHAVEIWLNGQRLKGRFLWQYAPIEPGKPRQWLFTRPEDQKPYAETHDLGEIVRELASKGQQWLFWPKDPGNLGKGAQKIDVQQAARQLRKYYVLKAEHEQRYTLGVAYPADQVDAHGDYTTPEELERAAWEFMRRVQKGRATIGLMHRSGTDGAGTVVESYIYRGPDWHVGDQIVKSGDWLLGVIWDEQAWQLIKAGNISGYSIQGMARKE